MKKKLKFYVREYFTERGGYDVIHISPTRMVSFQKEDGELYCRHETEGRLARG
jgi:hypothetical protein